MADPSAKISAPTQHIISIEFFSRRGNREEDIINSTDASVVLEGKARWFSYSFVRPVFLTSIEVKTEGYSSFDKFEFVIDHVDGTQHDEKFPVGSGSVNVRLGKLCRGFRFRPEKKWFSDPKLISVIAMGYTEEEFHNFEWAIKELEQRTSDLVAREERLLTQTEKTAELRQERVDLEAAIGRATAERDQLAKGIDVAEARKNALDAQILQVQKDFSTSSEILSDIRAEIDRDTAKRDALIRELRLFPSEIAGFVREGNRSIKWYLGIGAPFSLILAIICIILFSNSVELTHLYKREDNIDVWVIFLTRLPFVFVAAALIEVCGYIVGRLVFEIVRINRQRIEFSKLSIIAKDVSSAASELATGLTDEVVFDRETKLKMELLREHMKNYVGSEFEYRGTGFVAAIMGVAERFSKQKD